MNRRGFLGGLGGSAITIATALWFSSGEALAALNSAAIEALGKNWRDYLAADAEIELSTDPVKRDAAEWRKLVGKRAYTILFKEGTEAPNSHPYNDEKREGLFVCAACSLPLFSSAMKYDSRTGWPSFFTSIPNHLATKKDFKLIWPRTEYHCVKCGGHQGHLFDDGPRPTKQRWCNNGLALRFIPRG